MKRIVKAFLVSCLLAALLLIPAAASKAADASAPAAVKNFRVASKGNRTFILKWNRVSDADGYVIYHKDLNTGKYKVMAYTKDTTYTTPKLKLHVDHSFKIKSYRRVSGRAIYSEASEELTDMPTKIDLTIVHGRYYNMTLKSDTTVVFTATGRKKVLPKGTKVVAHSKDSGTILANLTDGREIKISGSALTYNSLNTVKKYYSKNVLETFVNVKGYESDTDYLIWINQYTLSTMIFKGSKGEWKLVRKCPCVIGRDGATPVRVFKLVHIGRGFGAPFLYIRYFPARDKGYGFHRRIDSTSRDAVSGGCIRLGDSDLYYMYRHCPLGTTVVSW